MYTTREIYSVFADNLRMLIQRRQVSVSSVCRDIEINRTQFNRYLSGQASPRPDILYRICNYFNVDARILLEPMEVLERGSVLESIDEVVSFLGPINRFDGLMGHVPTGIHRFWQGSTVQDGWFNSYTVRVFEVDNKLLFRALSDPGADRDFSRVFRTNRSEFRGYLLKQPEGMIVQGFQSGSSMMSFSVLHPSAILSSQVFHGVTLISRPELKGVRRIVRCAFEILPQGAGLREAMRGRGGASLKDLPEYLRMVLAGPAS